MTKNITNKIISLEEQIAFIDAQLAELSNALESLYQEQIKQNQMLQQIIFRQSKLEQQIDNLDNVKSSLVDEIPPHY